MRLGSDEFVICSFYLTLCSYIYLHSLFFPFFSYFIYSSVLYYLYFKICPLLSICGCPSVSVLSNDVHIIVAEIYDSRERQP